MKQYLTCIALLFCVTFINAQECEKKSSEDLKTQIEEGLQGVEEWINELNYDDLSEDLDLNFNDKKLNREDFEDLKIDLREMIVDLKEQDFSFLDNIEIELESAFDEFEFNFEKLAEDLEDIFDTDNDVERKRGLQKL